MKRAVFTAIVAVAMAATLSAADAPDIAQLTEIAKQRETRIGWWREARFGMFVHWGPSSILGGTWHGKPYGGYAEHIQRMAKIPQAVYRAEVIEKFNPVKFDADAWIRLAKETGMGYFIITSKHHDGFAMFDSKASDYNIVKATPFHRDPMKELREAARKYGIKFGFYYSHAFDWGEENAPGNDWEWKNPGGDKLLHGEQWWKTYPAFLPKVRKYVDEKSIPQILELIKNYNPDIMWFDTPHKLPPEENLRILAAIRKADPNVVVNSRIVIPSVPSGAELVDYLNTADRPAEIRPTPGDWEGIPTTNESYGYNQNDHSHKPPAFFIRLLAKCSARGGNMLMNMGPRGDGTVDPKDVAIFQGIGEWWKVNGQSIRGTSRTPLAVQAWGESTLRQGTGQALKGNTLYLHVFQWPGDGKLVVGGLKNDVAKAYLLADPSKTLSVARQGIDLIVSVPAAAPDTADSVVALELAGPLQVDPVRLLATNVGEDTLRVFDAANVGRLGFGPGKSSDAWVMYWKHLDDAVIWKLRLNEKATFQLAAAYDAPTDIKRNRIVEGDAGKEILRTGKGNGGTYKVSLGNWNCTKTVRTGIKVREELGQLTLEPGIYELRVTAEKITGEELMRLRSITLKPAGE